MLCFFKERPIGADIGRGFGNGLRYTGLVGRVLLVFFIAVLLALTPLKSYGQSKKLGIISIMSMGQSSCLCLQHWIPWLERRFKKDSSNQKKRFQQGQSSPKIHYTLQQCIFTGRYADDPNDHSRPYIISSSMIKNRNHENYFFKDINFFTYTLKWQSLS